MSEGNAEGAAEVKAQAHRKVAALLPQIEMQLAGHGGPWFLGDTYSALDAYVFTLCRWTRNFTTDRARDLPVTGPYLQRMLQRPAVQRVLQAEQLSPPFV